MEELQAVKAQLEQHIALCTASHNHPHPHQPQQQQHTSTSAAAGHAPFTFASITGPLITSGSISVTVEDLAALKDNDELLKGNIDQLVEAVGTVAAEMQLLQNKVEQLEQQREAEGRDKEAVQQQEKMQESQTAERAEWEAGQQRLALVQQQQTQLQGRLEGLLQELLQGGGSSHLLPSSASASSSSSFPSIRSISLEEQQKVPLHLLLLPNPAVPSREAIRGRWLWRTKALHAATGCLQWDIEAFNTANDVLLWGEQLQRVQRRGSTGAGGKGAGKSRLRQGSLMEDAALQEDWEGKEDGDEDGEDSWQLEQRSKSSIRAERAGLYRLQLAFFVQQPVPFTLLVDGHPLFTVPAGQGVGTAPSPVTARKESRAAEVLSGAASAAVAPLPISSLSGSPAGASNGSDRAAAAAAAASLFHTARQSARSPSSSPSHASLSPTSLASDMEQLLREMGGVQEGGQGGVPGRGAAAAAGAVAGSAARSAMKQSPVQASQKNSWSWAGSLPPSLPPSLPASRAASTTLHLLQQESTSPQTEAGRPGTVSAHGGTGKDHHLAALLEAEWAQERSHGGSEQGQTAIEQGSSSDRGSGLGGTRGAAMLHWQSSSMSYQQDASASGLETYRGGEGGHAAALAGTAAVIQHRHPQGGLCGPSLCQILTLPAGAELSVQLHGPARGKAVLELEKM